MLSFNVWERLNIPSQIGHVLRTALVLISAVLITLDAVSASSIQEATLARPTYIVVLKDKPLAHYSGGIPGYRPLLSDRSTSETH